MGALPKVRWVIVVVFMALLLDGGLSESVAAGKARFFRNGERFAQSEGLSIDLPAYNLKVENVVAHLSSLDNDLVPPLEIQSTRIYTARGKEVTLTNEMVEGDYFLLPPGQLWMWSPTDVGHKITFEVDDVASPIANKKLALESLSSSPKVFFIHNLVSDKEAADLIKHAEKRITASTVGSIDPQLDAGRTSQNTWDSTIPASKDIIQRVYSLLRIPYAEVTVDGLQIVQYSPGKFYNSHLDFLESDNATPENNLLPHLGGTNRYATVFFYLNDVPEGGQTAFTKGEHLSDEDLAKISPELVPLLSTHKTEMDLTRMEEVLGRTNGLEKTMLGLCHSKLSVRPQKLSALLFYNTHPDLVVDEMALHGGCPVLEGIKWGANLWVWNGDKSGMAGQTHNNIELNFYNMFDESVDIYWDNHGEHTYLTTLESGMGSQHETFHHHAFVMMVGDEVVDNYVVDFHRGLNQHVNIPLSGEQPSYGEIELNIENQSEEELSIFWIDDSEKLNYLTGLPPGGLSTHGTVNGHRFEILRGNNDPNGQAIKSYTVMTSLGAQQKVTINRGMFPRKQERWFDKLFKWEL